MESIVGIMQKVAEHAAQKIYTTELGIVTAVFPHAAESDKDNYQCSVKLKNRKQPDGSDFELRKVPVATQHLGLVNIPNVGDLVLVSFIGGSLNAPVIIGRLYNDEDLPPVNNEKEFLLQHDLEKGGSLKIDAEGVVTIASQDGKTSVTVEDGVVTIDNGKCKITVADSGVTIDAASNNVTVKSTGSVKIGDATTAGVELGGRAPGNAVADNDDLMLTMHTHIGNLGAPCPILIPMEKLNSIQAKARNTKVG